MRVRSSPNRYSNPSYQPHTPLINLIHQPHPPCQPHTLNQYHTHITSPILYQPHSPSYHAFWFTHSGSPTSETLMASLTNPVTQAQSNIPVKFDRAQSNIPVKFDRAQSNNHPLSSLPNTSGHTASLSSLLLSSSSSAPLLASIHQAQGLAPGQGLTSGQGQGLVPGQRQGLAPGQGQGLAPGQGLSRASLSLHMNISNPMITALSEESSSSHNNHSTDEINNNQAQGPGPGLGSYPAQGPGLGLGSAVVNRPSVRFAPPSGPGLGLGLDLGGQHQEEEELEDGGMGQDGQDRAVINHAAATLQVSWELMSECRDAVTAMVLRLSHPLTHPRTHPLKHPLTHPLTHIHEHTSKTSSKTLYYLR